MYAKPSVTQTPAEIDGKAVIGGEKRASSGTSDEEPEIQEQEPHHSALSAPPDDVVPTTKTQFLVIFIALILAIFCVALDNTIIVTAIPRITDDYRTLNDVGW